MYNPEPLAPFVDIVSLGEGEEVTGEMIQLYRQAKAEGWEQGGLPPESRPDPRAVCALPVRRVLIITPTAGWAAVTPPGGGPHPG